MDEPIDFCKYFSNIEADPSAIAPRLTVRQFLQAREHVYGCDVCFNRMERVLSRALKETKWKQGMN